MKHKILSALLVFAMVLALAGCSGSDSAPANGSSAGGNNNAAMTMVGVAVTGTAETNPYGAALEQRLKEQGYSVETAYSAEGTQTAQIGDMVSDGASILIVESENVDDVKKALESASVDVAAVPVIALDTPVDSDSVNAFVGMDFADLGKKQAEFIADALKLEDRDEEEEPLTVEFVAPTSASAQKALDAAMEVLKPYMDAGKLTVPSGNTTSDAIAAADAGEWAKELFTSTYDGENLNAILCFGDGQGEAVSDAVFSSYTGSVFPLIAAAGNTPRSVEQLNNGYLGMVTLYDADEVITHVVDAVSTIMNSAGKPVHEQYTAVTAVPRSDLQTVLVDSGLYTLNEDGTFTRN